MGKEEGTDGLEEVDTSVKIVSSYYLRVYHFLFM